MSSDEFNPYAAPKADLRDPEAHGTEIWRDGRLLVVTRHSLFPDRCLHCNQPTTLRSSWTMTWYEPTPFLLSVSRRASFQVPLCEQHRRRRLWQMALGWLMYLGAFGSPGLAVVLGPLVVFLFPILIVVGLIFLQRALNIASIDHAREGVVWLLGVSPAFLDELPEWQG